MKLTKVKIGNNTYQIIVKQRIELNDKEVHGLIDFERCTIHLKALNKQIKQVLLHEIIHGVEDMYSLELTEQQVDSLANGLLLVLKNNPKIKDFLLSKK